MTIPIPISGSAETPALFSPPSVPLLRRTALVCSAVALGIAATALIGGWILGVTSLRNLIPGTVEMKSWTALGLLAGAVALLLLLRGTSGRRLGQALSLGMILLGTVVAAEYLFHVDLGIDELLFVDSTGRRMGIAHPGRFAPTTAASFIMVGLALLTLDVRPFRGWRVAELLVIPVALIAALSVVGYLYSIPALYGPASAAKMALNSAVCFLALSAGILAARPRGRLVALALTDDPGGVLIRRTIPLAVVVPLLLGWALLRSVEGNLVGLRAATWWLSALTIVGFALLLIRVAARLSRAAAERHVLEQDLMRLANEDALTGQWNRRRFDEELQLQVLRCQRYRETAALLMLDLDHFKAVNDRHGHKVGDDLIRHVAVTLRERLRGSDCLARLGGDEFAILLPNTTADDAATTAALLRGWLADRPFAHHDEELAVMASVGVAFLDHTTTDEQQAMIAADVAMYDAKAAGRDQVSGLRRPPSTATGSVRVLHRDDSKAYRTLLTEMLRAHPDIEVIPSSSDRDGLSGEITRSQPDVMLLDIVGDGDIADVVADARAAAPDMRILLLSGLDAPPPPLAEQTDGFVSKVSTFDQIADAVRAVARVGAPAGG